MITVEYHSQSKDIFKISLLLSAFIVPLLEFLDFYYMHGQPSSFTTREQRSTKGTESFYEMKHYVL